MKFSLAFLLSLGFVATLSAQDNPGRASFETRCAICHGADAHGTARGPSIYEKLAARNNTALAAFIRTGSPAGMPAFANIADAEMTTLIAHLRTLQPAATPAAPAAGAGRGAGRGGGRGPVLPRDKVTLTDGKTIDGVIVALGTEDRQMRTDDGIIHLLRKANGGNFREVTSTVDWPGYNGDPRGNRYTTMTQITPANVSKLQPRWFYTMPTGQGLQGTPQVVGGIMYATAVNDVVALDAGSGRQIWRYNRPLTPNVNASSNRGVAVVGDRIYTVTDNAHLIALNRFTGALAWETTMADHTQSYFSTGAPLAVGNLLIAGVGGGEHGTRGFVAAYDQTTGKEEWRVWTVPAKGEPGAETWNGKDIDHGGAPTWMTGTYDAELDTLYWPTGNPSKEYDGADRLGDNLYSDSVLALEPKTGKLKWYFQFTPHDLWDWDATETPVLIDANFQGQPRKLLVQANRNGFFYVLDRTNGKFLTGKKFVNWLTWASGLDANGKPIKLPNQEPTPAGTRVCPSQDGATNWYSPSYIPATGLFYFQTHETCSVYRTIAGKDWTPMQQYLGGVQGNSAPDVREHILRAVDINTGNIKWEYKQQGNGGGKWGGTIATATGIVFVEEETGAISAVDGTSGKVLWSFQTAQNWKASPMMYMFDGKQYLATIANNIVMSFALSD